MPAPLLAALAIAWALHALPFQVAVQPPSGDEPTTAAVRVAEARVRYYAALDAAHWDRDDAALRPVADAVTLELLTGAPGDDALALAAEIGADALGPWLRVQTAPPPQLLRAYLYSHDDAGLLARLVAAQATPTAVDIACDLARANRASAAASLAQQFASIHSSYTRAIACGAALDVPGPARLVVARAVVATWRNEPADDLAPQCVALGSLVREGRAHVATWLRRLEAPATSAAFQVPPMWIGVALLAMAGSDQATLAQATVDRLMGERTTLSERLYYWTQVVEPLGDLVGWLPHETPVARALLERLATVMFSGQRWVVLARLRSGDGGVVADALERIARTDGSHDELQSALTVVGLAAGTTAAESIEVRMRLANLSSQSGERGQPYPAQQEIDAWIDAIAQVAACAGRAACLVGLLDHGSDDAAARAIHALGPRGLARLSPAEAQPLLRRLLIGPTPALTAAYAITVEGCPASLRGARAIRETETTGAAPFLRVLRRACADVTP